jgi:methylated-DNA-protein-cysteine methyltransferase-like protein
MLTGKHAFGDPQRMEQLLRDEGIEVVNDRVLHFERLFWDPLMEL